MRPIEIAKDTHWVGALDPQLRRFDIIMAAENGTTYNAYLIQGKDKTALIDLVKTPFAEEFFTNLKTLLGPATVDYVILSHTEPDHSGSLAMFLERYPATQVICSRTAAQFVANLLNRDVNPRLVEDGETLDLGGRKLTFYQTPFLHWPDTMMSYLEPEKVLFGCDFLGAHYCDDRLFDDLVGDFSYAFKYYYDCIMRPFKPYMLKALDKIDKLDLAMVAPGHGPIIRSDPKKYIELYRNWSTPPKKDKKSLAIFYASAYGNTAQMAREIAAGAEAAGVKVGLYDAVATSAGHALDKIEEADGVLFGSPTMNADAIEPIWALISAMATIRVRGKVGGAFGSSGWSGEAPRQLEERLKGLKFKVPASAPRVTLVPTKEDLVACRSFGAEIAKAIVGE